MKKTHLQALGRVVLAALDRQDVRRLRRGVDAARLQRQEMLTGLQTC